MKGKKRSGRAFFRRVEALALAVATLWTVRVTAGSSTARSAWEAMQASSPIQALRWELGDWWPDDTLSPAAVLTLGESPLLLSARTAVAELWSSERSETPPAGEGEEPVVTVPVEESPQPAPSAGDNGIPARTLVPTGPDGYTVCGRAYITNSTDHALSVAALSEPFAAELTGEGPQILILHTHGSEAYTPAGAEPVWSGSHRTTDARYNVVHVGDVMADVFSESGISVLHDRTLYDYPSYAGSYDRSLAAIQSYLAQYPTIRFILDVHRDAIEDRQGNEYKVVASAGDTGVAAQMTLVVGSDGSGLTHPNWMENLKLATALQESVLERYPELMRPILLRNSRYNQHATAGSLLLEVGAAGNSPEEAALAGQLFARQMVETLEARSK